MAQLMDKNLEKRLLEKRSQLFNAARVLAPALAAHQGSHNIEERALIEALTNSLLMTQIIMEDNGLPVVILMSTKEARTHAWKTGDKDLLSKLEEFDGR